MDEILKIALSIIGSVATSGAIIFGLSNWLGKLWASQLIEREKTKHKAELEFLTRKRDIYAKLAVNMRVFLESHETAKPDRRKRFFEAYDEAYLWASQEVVEDFGRFIDLMAKDPDSVSEKKRQSAYSRCLHSLRIDSGHNKSKSCYRVASF